jgi:hypothetical protein
MYTMNYTQAKASRRRAADKDASQQQSKLSAAKAFGIWMDHKDLSNVMAFVRKLRKTRSIE